MSPCPLVVHDALVLHPHVPFLLPPHVPASPLHVPVLSPCCPDTHVPHPRVACPHVPGPLPHVPVMPTSPRVPMSLHVPGSLHAPRPQNIPGPPHTPMPLHVPTSPRHPAPHDALTPIPTPPVPTPPRHPPMSLRPLAVRPEEGTVTTSSTVVPGGAQPYHYTLRDTEHKALCLQGGRLVALSLQGANDAQEEAISVVPNRHLERRRCPLIVGIRGGSQALSCGP
uniref:Uncharacterized protein n=1 Tax=Cairina moschata TaxID=8855 RepID=A0A8C3CDI9_CAIMO